MVVLVHLEIITNMLAVEFSRLICSVVLLYYYSWNWIKKMSHVIPGERLITTYETKYCCTWHFDDGMLENPLVAVGGFGHLGNHEPHPLS